MSDNNDYETGYKKPPKDHQFRPSQSGNPKGRPKGSKNLLKLVDKELEEVIFINENGQRLKVTKREAIARQLVNGALQMDAKAIRAILPIIDEISAQETAREADLAKRKLSEEDEQMMQRFLQQEQKETTEGEDDE